MYSLQDDEPVLFAWDAQEWRRRGSARIEGRFGIERAVRPFDELHAAACSSCPR
ncbi:MAG: hypothetical protein GKR94_13305 [Gammaproteobacteria bacterium]|nr:hypothetical protein [Gammaproteobacteria bacterium]